MVEAVVQSEACKAGIPTSFFKGGDRAGGFRVGGSGEGVVEVGVEEKVGMAEAIVRKERVLNQVQMKMRKRKRLGAEKRKNTDVNTVNPKREMNSKHQKKHKIRHPFLHLKMW